MNRVKRFLLDRKIVKPKTIEESNYITKSILTNYSKELSIHDSEASLPSMITDAIIPKKELSKGIGMNRPVPFIPRKEYSYIEPDYDFTIVSRLLNSEAIFMRVVKRYVEQIMKSGYEIVSQDRNNLDIVNQKLTILTHAMSGPNPGHWTFTKFIDQLAFNLVAFNNVFIHRKKSEEQGFGNSWQLFGHSGSQTIEPISGLFIEDPVKMRAKMAQDGKILEWISDANAYYGRRRNRPYSGVHNNYGELRNWFGMFNPYLHYSNKSDPNIVRYKPDEIDHIKGPSTQCGLLMAMPMVWPIIPDIKALRAMEEHVEMMVYQYSTGILHGKIGTDDLPQQPGEEHQFREAIEMMEGNGFLVTPSRWELEHINTGSAIDIAPYLQWFLNRMFMGFGTNPSIMGLGESTNKASSGALSLAFQGSVILFKKAIADYINSLFDHFLLEQGMSYWELNETNRVRIKFGQIDIEHQVLANNDTIQKWLNNTISFNEMREQLGESPIEEHDGKFFKDFVTVEVAEAQNELDINVTKAQAAQRNAVSNKTAPANQNGKRSGPKSKL